MRRTFNNSMRQLTLMHDFSPVEIPAVIHDLTPDLLREVFDQTMHYGFPALFDDKPGKTIYLHIKDEPVKVSALMDEGFLTLSIGSTRNNPFYLLTRKGFIFWQSNLRVSDIAGALKELDEKMAVRGYYDSVTNTRENVLAEGIFFVDDIFCREFDYIVLPEDLNHDPRHLFEYPRKLRVLELHGRRVICRAEDADEVTASYKPISKLDIEESKCTMEKGFHSQYNPKRYE